MSCDAFSTPHKVVLVKCAALFASERLKFRQHSEHPSDICLKYMLRDFGDLIEGNSQLELCKCVHICCSCSRTSYRYYRRAIFYVFEHETLEILEILEILETLEAYCKHVEWKPWFILGFSRYWNIKKNNFVATFQLKGWCEGFLFCSAWDECSRLTYSCCHGRLKVELIRIIACL